MLQICRPAGRLFYLVLAVVITASGVRLMTGEVAAKNGERPTSPSEPKARAAEPAVSGAAPSPQSGPTLTSVVDTVYLADGTPAQGVLVITWPAFVTASGSAVGAGTLDVTLGTSGALNVALAANAGATPAGVYYTVVYQLGPGEVRTRILGGADEFSGNAGDGANDAGSGNGGATGIDAIRELGSWLGRRTIVRWCICRERRQ